MTDVVESAVQVGLLIAVILGVIGLVASVAVAFERRGGGGWRSLWSREARPALAMVVLVFLYTAAVPFAAPVAGGGAETGLKLSLLVVAPAGAYFAARRLRQGWAVLGSVSVLVGSVWLFAMSTLKAYQWGWHGLDVRDIRSDDISEEVGMAMVMVIGTALVLLPGVVIGMLAARGHEAPGEDVVQG